jgi:hypothetical protein
MLLAVIASAGVLASCGGGPSADDLVSVDYAPTSADVGWAVSTPADHGLDPDAVAELYWRAGQLDSINSLLVVKDGALVGEEYFHDGSPTYRQMVASVTKSVTGALVGIAIDQGCLPSVDEPMMTYFPELADQVQDRRKNSITIRSRTGRSPPCWAGRIHWTGSSRPTVSLKRATSAAVSLSRSSHPDRSAGRLQLTSSSAPRLGIRAFSRRRTPTTSR